MDSVSFETLMPVCDSWSLIKRSNPRWNVEFGNALFRNIFEAAPLSLTLLFPFGAEGEKMIENPQYQSMATETTNIVDFIVTSMGADMEIVKMQLMETFLSHPNFQRLRREHWVALGRALVKTLEESLGDKWNTNLTSCWASAFDVVSTMMMEEMKAGRR